MTSGIKLTLEYIKQKTKELAEDYECLSEDYIKNNEKLKFKCNENHIFYMTWINFYSCSARCKICYDKLRGKSQRLNIDNIKKKVEDMNIGYKCLSNNYKNCYTKLKLKCNFGHIFTISWNDFQQGARCSTCCIINRSGNNHYNWKGGISNLPYCDIWADKEYKESIKERDNYKCQNEYCWKVSKRLSIHHIDYDKLNCVPYNLITTCASCNSRANKNKKYWKRYFKKRIKEIYNG